MATELTEAIVTTIKDAARQLRGQAKRAFQARVAIDYLNRFGFRLRRVQKTKPAKKIKETDAIFTNVARANREADEDPACLRISIDSKAKVKIGAFSRGGRSRAEKK